MVETLPVVDVSPDPYDNYLLSIAVGGAADYLVTGGSRTFFLWQAIKEPRLFPYATS